MTHLGPWGSLPLGPARAGANGVSSNLEPISPERASPHAIPIVRLVPMGGTHHEFGAARGVVCTTFALVGRSLTLGPDGDGNVGGEGSTVRSVTQQWTPTSGFGRVDQHGHGWGWDTLHPRFVSPWGAASHPGTPEPRTFPPGRGAR